MAELRRSGRWTRSGPVRVLWMAGPEGDVARVAYAVGRAVGPAVVRNRVRRRARAIVASAPPPPGSYLVSVAPAAAELSFGELQSHLKQVFEQVRASQGRR